jgi:hypothetical protein
VALDNGRVVFDGDRDSFNRSGLIKTLGQTTHGGEKDDLEEKKLLVDIEEKVLGHGEGVQQESNSTAESTHGSDGQKKEKKPPRKLIEDEVRAVGRIKKDVWAMFFQACGSPWFWSLFVLVFVLAAVSVVVENNWLRCVQHSAYSISSALSTFFLQVLVCFRPGEYRRKSYFLYRNLHCDQLRRSHRRYRPLARPLRWVNPCVDCALQEVA